MQAKRWIVLGAVAAFTAGCPAEEDTDTGAGETTGNDESSGGGTVGMTGQMSTSVGTSASTEMTIGTEEESSGGPVPQENGALCEADAECVSGYCYVIELIGGICGECNADADCESGGCSLPNPLSSPPVGAHCNMGEPGAGCMSDEICQDGYVCATILEVPGILEAATCSECLEDVDCEAGTLCSPTYDVLNISGQNICREPGTVPNGEGCDFDGTGDMACMSGLCAAVNIMMLLEVGVCGDCEVDVDCTAPEVCLEASVDIVTGVVTPPICGTMP
ncbi:MAG: hypothetical protein IAG13_32480 [Deltaproteobacteria bacterium]|nr:hypothetical protein [Nannocystaceae bacterium]